MEKRFPPEGSLRTKYGEHYEGDLACDSFTLRRIIGEDELAAAERAFESSSIGVNDELICDAFVAVDDQPVQRPYQGWKTWDSVTRDFVRAAFSRFNNARSDDLVDFLEEAFGKPREPNSKSASSASSPGSPGISKGASL